MASQQDNITRERVERAIMEFSPMVSLDSKTTFDDVRCTIGIFMRQHPEIFWFSHQYRYDEKTGVLKLKYNFTKEKAYFFKGEIEKVVKDDFQIDYVKRLSETERLVYVYKWIGNRTTYNEYSSFNQTIFSVLANRNSVCTGYAKTAQYLLNLVGIESELVFGKFHFDKSEHGRHGWNIVKINDKWCHMDFCLADRTLSYLLNKDESPKENDHLLWNYFGVPTDKILSNRSIEFIETLASCKDTLYDFPEVELRKPRKQLICCKSDSGTSSRIYLDSSYKNRVIKVSNNGQTGLLNNETTTLSKLSDCKHIIKSYGLNESGLSLEQLTPWSELLNSHYYNPTESDLWNILRQLIEGLFEIRDKDISYSDIHYNNVFVTRDGTYKWGDFGIAFHNQTDGKLPLEMIGDDGKAKGSYWFMSSETYYHNVFTEASAIYSVAMMAYFVMNDMRPPFWTDEEHQQEALTKRLNGQDIPAPIFVKKYNELWRIIRDSLNLLAHKRSLTFDDFLLSLENNVVIVNADKAECDIDIVVDDNVEMPLFTDVNSDGSVDYDFSTTDSTDNNISFDDIEHFATTKGGRWGDGDIHDSDSFASTTASLGNSFHQPSETYNSYQPQKKSPLKTIIKKSSSWLCNFWKISDSSANTEVEYYYENNINACVYAPAQIQPMKNFHC